MSDRSHEGTSHGALPLREVLDADVERGVALFDADAKLVYANPAARAFLHPFGGPAGVALPGAVAAFRDRSGKSGAATLPVELPVDTSSGERARATISALPSALGIWFVVRFAPPSTLREPTLRRLQAQFQLTPREAQVALLVARGRANGEIATSLGIHEKTVKNSLMSVFRKCGARNRVELALRAHDSSATGQAE